MAFWSDIWRVGLVEAPVVRAAGPGLATAPVRWLPLEQPYAFIADPFGLWRDGRLHVFVEAYDYRTGHGVIDRLRFDAALQGYERRTVLSEPWHLSYPFLVEGDGETWMAPEAHRSGGLTLYRAVEFPDRWEPAVRLELDTPAIDPTLFRHAGLWWLAYAPAGPQSAKQGRLHLAYAEQIRGPWRTHPGNPVRIDRSRSRPGGAPFHRDGALQLPVQDCRRTYGGAIRLLTIEALTPDTFQAQAGPAICAPPSAGPFRHGLHTLAGCGDLTLIDVKRVDRAPAGLAVDLGRWFGRGRDAAADAGALPRVVDWPNSSPT